jgi:hypothetical protein
MREITTAVVPGSATSAMIQPLTKADAIIVIPAPQ